jgi:hypothetical protein
MAKWRTHIEHAAAKRTRAMRHPATISREWYLYILHIWNTTPTSTAKAFFKVRRLPKIVDKAKVE